MLRLVDRSLVLLFSLGMGMGPSHIGDATGDVCGVMGTFFAISPIL